MNKYPNSVQEMLIEDPFVTDHGFDSKPYVFLPGYDRTLTDVAIEVGEILSKFEIFISYDKMVILNDDRNGFVEMTPQAFRTWIEEYLVFLKHVPSKDGSPAKPKKTTIGKNDADALLQSPFLLKPLRKLRKVNNILIPVWGKKGAIRLCKKGYDSKNFTYTAPKTKYSKSLSIDEAKRFLESLLEEFPFAERERNMSVIISLMLTLYARELLHKDARLPAFITIANTSGAGKTLLNQIAVIATTGKKTVRACSNDEEEIRKLLLGTVVDGSVVQFFDNLKEHLSSPSLEAYLTSSEWEDRKLGSNKSISGKKDAVVIITGNGLTVSRDLARRSLWVELISDEVRAEDRPIKNLLTIAKIEEARPKILACLWAFVREWYHAGCPVPTVQSNSFFEWNHIIGGIMEYAGYCNPTIPSCLQTGGDTETKDFESLVAHMPDNTSITFDEIIAICAKKGLFESYLNGVESTDKMSPKDKSRLGIALSKKHLLICKSKRFVVEGQGHARRFKAQLAQ